MRPLEITLIDLILGEAPEELLEGHSAFLAREALPNAEMVALSEMHRAVEFAADIEAVGILELALVAVGGACEQEDSDVCWNRDAMTRPRLRAPTALDLRWGIYAE